ncbi:hypothetical protein GCM10010149_82490 [Nonomuraea roseoviolacea subsp. roseoviolacea]|uniref:hypothetical protein n=1 Tax=Nonomuraea roseoviolacea TaxID=103837 RepID=UPI0031D5DA1F
MTRPTITSLIALLALVGAILLTPRPAAAATGLRVSGTRVVEANGNAFVVLRAAATGSFAVVGSFARGAGAAATPRPR